MFAVSTLPPLLTHYPPGLFGLFAVMCLDSSLYIAGFNIHALIQAELRRRDDEEAAKAGPPEPALQKEFIPDNNWTGDWPENMLADSFEPALWAQFEKRPLELAKKSWVDHSALEKEAERLKFPNKKLVREVSQMLQHGARTGVSGAARLPSHGPNSPTLQGLGPQVLDTLRTWCREEVLCGPLEEHEVPPNAKSSPLAAVLKLSGKARLINNQSHPHLEAPDLEGDTPISFNDGINSDLYPTLQITSKHLLRRLTLVGKGARAAKVDMENAVSCYFNPCNMIDYNHPTPCSISTCRSTRRM